MTNLILRLDYGHKMNDENKNILKGGRALYSQRKTKRTRNVSHETISPQERRKKSNTRSPSRNLKVEVLNNLLIRLLPVGTEHTLIPQNNYFRLFFLRLLPILRGSVRCTFLHADLYAIG